MSNTNAEVVLLVEDSPTLAALYRAYLRDMQVEVVHCKLGQEALDWLELHTPSAVLLDLILPDMHGMDILQHLQAQHVNYPIIVITAHGSVDVVVSAMRAGAHDFIEKPFDEKRLRLTLSNSLKYFALNQRVKVLSSELNRESFHGFIGRSLVMQGIYRIIESAAPSKATVFIKGESGTGKEVCAEAIHRESPRATKPFVAINCAAIPHDLMESEIFGHVKGAFTGAVAERSGAAERANGGTLFLDEICEMDLDLQSKLLRFIQTGTFQKVGGSSVQKVDVRFICATNKDPMEEVQAGRFREDLYYRLHVIPIRLPPLRERGEDLLLIARALLAEFAQEEGKSYQGFNAAVEAVFMDYPWPGNVRQLQNVVRNIVVLNSGGLVTESMLPEPFDQHHEGHNYISPVKRVVSQVEESQEPILPLAKVERVAIERALKVCDGNVSRAAELLEVSPSTLYRKLQSWQNE